ATSRTPSTRDDAQLPFTFPFRAWVAVSRLLDSGLLNKDRQGNACREEGAVKQLLARSPGRETASGGAPSGRTACRWRALLSLGSLPLEVSRPGLRTIVSARAAPSAAPRRGSAAPPPRTPPVTGRRG